MDPNASKGKWTMCIWILIENIGENCTANSTSLFAMSKCLNKIIWIREANICFWFKSLHCPENCLFCKERSANCVKGLTLPHHATWKENYSYYNALHNYTWANYLLKMQWCLWCHLIAPNLISSKICKCLFPNVIQIVNNCPETAVLDLYCWIDSKLSSRVLETGIDVLVDLSQWTEICMIEVWEE